MIKDGFFKDEYGDIFIYKNEMIHCENGPAIIRKNGDKEWYVNGDLHREDGPAIEESCGNKK